MNPPRAGEYRTILIDPPWKYDTDSGIGMCPSYQMMDDMAILNLPVKEWTAENCLLLLWTTNSHMPLAVKCVEHWGFEWKTMLTWDKVLSNAGTWLKHQTEHLIIAKRGGG